ncbi:MAG: FHA domain-containing protein, partial [Anaerolineae bacterium]|nr:FHA domain-containing protein [Anaerolineae bacterium]MDW8071230.1 FHA domain-containing protein [Anaerolineae bacterium]
MKHTGERTEYPLDATVIHLGREQARTIPIDDPLVSPHHAEITWVAEAQGAGAWVIRDLGSPNGTYVNDTLLTTSHRLRVGDRIRLGNTLFTYEEMESGQGFRNVIAVLIALSTLVGALVAWRASVAIDDAASARSDGTHVL